MRTKTNRRSFSHTRGLNVMSQSAGKEERSVEPGENEHGSIEPKPIPASEYSTKFLSDLKARGQVRAVDEGWRADQERLPPDIHWVLYPNGDLLRIGFG